MALQKVASMEDLWAGEMMGLTVGQTPLLLVNWKGGVHAFVDCCAHMRVRLSEGLLRDGVLTCRAHGWQYEACTGHGINPAAARLTPLPLELRGDEIWVDVELAVVRFAGEVR